MSGDSPIKAGDVFAQANIPFFQECVYEWVSDGAGARQEPMRDEWRMGERETQYGHEADGYGRFEIHVIEVVGTESCGDVAIYERRWFSPDGDRLDRGRKRFCKTSALRSTITRRKMAPSRPDTQDVG